LRTQWRCRRGTRPEVMSCRRRPGRRPPSPSDRRLQGGSDVYDSTWVESGSLQPPADSCPMNVPGSRERALVTMPLPSASETSGKGTAARVSAADPASDEWPRGMVATLPPPAPWPESDDQLPERVNRVGLRVPAGVGPTQ